MGCQVCQAQLCNVLCTTTMLLHLQAELYQGACVKMAGACSLNYVVSARECVSVLHRLRCSLAAVGDPSAANYTDTVGEAAADKAAVQEYVNQALRETLPGMRLTLLSTLAGNQEVYGAVKVWSCSGKQQARAWCTADVSELASSRMCTGQAGMSLLLQRRVWHN